MNPEPICTECPHCRGNTVDDHGHDCPDCEATGCATHPFCGRHESWLMLKRCAAIAQGEAA